MGTQYSTLPAVLIVRLAKTHLAAVQALLYTPWPTVEEAETAASGLLI